MKHCLRVIFVLSALTRFCALAQQPVIKYVVNSENQLPRVSPGDRALVFTSSLSNGDAKVQVGGLSAPVLSREPWIDDNDRPVGDILTIQIPIELAPGLAALSVSADGKASMPFGMNVDRYAPAFDPRTLERALPGGGYRPYSCLPGETPKAGEIVRAYVTGLGSTNPAALTGMPAPASPLSQTIVKPDIVVGGQAASVVESVLSPGEIGVYRVSFKVPAGGGLQSLALGIGGEAVIGPNVAVGNAISIRSRPTQAAQAFVEAYSCGGSLTSAVPSGAPQIVESGDGRNPPTTLGGSTMRVKDASGAERLASMLYISPIQVNFIVPPNTANGNSTLTLTTGDGVVSKGPLEVRAVAPWLLWDPVVFGAPVGLVVRVRDGAQIVEPLIRVNSSLQHQLVPIDLGPETDQVFLVLFGTGWRSRSSLAGVRLRFSTTRAAFDADVQYAGPQSEFAGLDQLNVRVPRALAGAGFALLTLTVDSEVANLATLVFK